MVPLITSVESFPSLAEAIRSGNACIAITELTGGDACIPDAYFGSLVVEGDEAELRLRSQSEKAFSIHFRSFLNNGDLMVRFDELKCILDGHLEVVIKRAFSTSEKSCSSTGVFHRYSFNQITQSRFNPDQEADQIRMSVKIARSKLQFKNQILNTEAWSSLEGKYPKYWKWDGLGGEIAPYRYRVSQDGEDLLLMVSLQDGGKSPSISTDNDFLRALILTFIWINGGHPYPYFRSHERNGEQVDSSIQPLKRAPNSKPRVMAPGSDEAGTVLECGIRFFQAGLPVALAMQTLLWEYREATANGSITLGKLLQACSLLEGLVGIVLKYQMGLSKSQIDKLRAPGQIVSDLRQGHAEARFHQVGTFLKFDWNKELLPVFQKWKDVRNSLAHGDVEIFLNSPNRSMINVYLSVIQAFNAITLRLVGYQGSVRMDGWPFAI